MTALECRDREHEYVKLTGRIGTLLIMIHEYTKTK